MPQEHQVKIHKHIFRSRVGSHLYGLSTPESDEDYIGVFIPDEEYILGLKNVDEIDRSTKKPSAQHRNIKNDVDDKAYSIKKFLKLVMQNNPNIVEVLFANPKDILLLEPEFKEIIDNYDKIISTRVFHSFTGYAYSQRKHLVVKRERFRSLGVGLKYLEDIILQLKGVVEARPITELEASELNHILKFYKGEKGNTEHFHKGMPLEHIYNRIKSEYGMYGWRVKELGFTGEGRDSYDVKFAYHLIRLLDEGRQLLEKGRIDFPIAGKAREDIIRIRNKEVPFDELMQMYEEYNKEVELAYVQTEVRKRPDFNWANKYLVRTLKKSLLGEG